MPTRKTFTIQGGFSPLLIQAKLNKDRLWEDYGFVSGLQQIKIVRPVTWLCDITRCTVGGHPIISPKVLPSKGKNDNNTKQKAPKYTYI